MILFTIAFVSVISEKLISATDDRARNLADDLLDVVDSELSLASFSQDGYSRVFTLPASLDGSEYGILFYNKSNTMSNFTQLVLTTAISGVDYSTVRILPENIIGSVSTGDNFVRKHNGMVNISPQKALFSIGEPCSSGGECQSGNCYADSDGDGYGVASGAVCKASASLGNDCYDFNENAKPGQTSYFATNRGDGSFDYDCDSSITSNLADCYVYWPGYNSPACTQGTILGQGSGTNPGWSSSPASNCGSTLTQYYVGEYSDSSCTTLVTGDNCYGWSPNNNNYFKAVVSGSSQSQCR